MKITVLQPTGRKSDEHVLIGEREKVSPNINFFTNDFSIVIVTIDESSLLIYFELNFA